MKLAQTLAGTWVITVANPEEDDWETELASFDVTATAENSVAREGINNMIAAGFVALTNTIGNANCDFRVTSHDKTAREDMLNRCRALNPLFPIS